MAFYLKYRPQKFNDLELTQYDVAVQLVSMVVKKSMAHAYLFTGSHGTGKTSSARILAKAINCAEFNKLKTVSKIPEDKIKMIKECVVPCNICDNCSAITAGNFLDVLEMDAASNRGIDEIRELKEKVKLSPVLGNKKVYIIDEVHMLTTEAFNALLKTLEEPPEHSIFILCTTELHKVPQTIQSRCVNILFKKPGVAEITKYIEMIAAKENISIDKIALKKAAELSGGAFRDAAKILEQAVLTSNVVDESLLNELFSATKEKSAEDFFELTATGNLKGLIELVKQLENDGVNFGYFIKELIGICRMILLEKAGAKQTLNKNLQGKIDGLSDNFILEMLELLLKALNQQKSTPIPSLPLELVCFRIMSKSVSSTKNIATPINSARNVNQENSKESKNTDKKPEAVGSVEIEPAIPNPTLEVLTDKWSEIVKLVRKYNASVAALLGKCKIIQFENKLLTLETQNTFQKDMIENPKKRDLIEQSMFELTGVEVKIKCVLGKTRLTPKVVDNIQSVNDTELVSVAMELFKV